MLNYNGCPPRLNYRPFIIYINDLPLISQIFDILIYADDRTLICNLDQHFGEKVLNSELNKINEWMYSNKLSLNVKKTKYIYTQHTPSK